MEEEYPFYRIVLGTIYYDKGQCCYLSFTSAMGVFFISLSVLIISMLFDQIDLGLKKVLELHHYYGILAGTLVFCIGMTAIVFRNVTHNVKEIVKNARRDVQRRREESLAESSGIPLEQIQRPHPEVNREIRARDFSLPDISPGFTKNARRDQQRRRQELLTESPEIPLEQFHRRDSEVTRAREFARQQSLPGFSRNTRLVMKRRRSLSESPGIPLEYIQRRRPVNMELRTRDFAQLHISPGLAENVGRDMQRRQELLAESPEIPPEHIQRQHPVVNAESRARDFARLHISPGLAENIRRDMQRRQELLAESPEMLLEHQRPPHHEVNWESRARSFARLHISPGLAENVRQDMQRSEESLTEDMQRSEESLTESAEWPLEEHQRPHPEVYRESRAREFARQFNSPGYVEITRSDMQRR